MNGGVKRSNTSITSKKVIDRSPYNPISIAVSFFGIMLFLLILLIFDDHFLSVPAIKLDGGAPLEEYIHNTDKIFEMYKQWAIVQNMQIFDWHVRSTKILFWLSISVAVSGIAFSFWQFSAAQEGEKRAAQSDELALKSQMISLAFKSRSIATLVLFISLAYLLIYVTLIYPIKDAPKSAILDISDGSKTQSDGRQTSKQVTPKLGSHDENLLTPDKDK